MTWRFTAGHTFTQCNLQMPVYLTLYLSTARGNQDMKKMWNISPQLWEYKAAKVPPEPYPCLPSSKFSDNINFTDQWQRIGHSWWQLKLSDHYNALGCDTQPFTCPRLARIHNLVPQPGQLLVVSRRMAQYIKFNHKPWIYLTSKHNKGLTHNSLIVISQR